MREHKTIEVCITETTRNSLKEKPSLCQSFVVEFENESQVREFLMDRYGRIPKGKNKIYIGESGVPIGYTYSFWNADYSHMPIKKWFQTDWITFSIIISGLKEV